MSEGSLFGRRLLLLHQRRVPKDVLRLGRESGFLDQNHFGRRNIEAFERKNFAQGATKES
ncbi:MAG: hypothetical protein CM15mP120_20750 [Pseudomonadota bacterium]|nr:MAG: hypothetical protein CM15mP120_20750 [Pseudomonadota bacterium]